MDRSHGDNIEMRPNQLPCQNQHRLNTAESYFVNRSHSDLLSVRGSNIHIASNSASGQDLYVTRGELAALLSFQRTQYHLSAAFRSSFTDFSVEKFDDVIG